MPTKMHPRLPQLHQILLSVILWNLVLADNLSMEACNPKSCGNITISYPFWIRGVHAPYCGYPSLEIECIDGKPFVVESYNSNYYIDTVFYENNSFVLMNSLWEGQTGNCYIPEYNLSIGLGPCLITESNKELVFFYDCQNVDPPSADYWPISCGGNQSSSVNQSFVRLFENYDQYSSRDVLSKCIISKIPVSGWNGKTVHEYISLMKDGFLLELQVPNCSDCKASKGQCGLNASTSDFMCICANGSTYPISCPNPKERGLHSRRMMIVIGLSITGALILILACLTFIFKLQMHCIFGRKYRAQEEIEMLLEKYASLIAPKRYRYHELKKITQSFRDKLGKGGFGTVYKGSLSDGSLVAVKLLHNSTSNGEEFLNEVISIGRTSHVNVVNLLGFCIEGSKHALIYEYMPKGSLDNYIYSENPNSILGWEKLYQIAVGIARGLEYLHKGCNNHIVHFDIKPQNILLDEEYCPKIADFGLAKLCPPKESILSMAEMRGTIGFIAPEVFSRSFGVVSTKSDVFSYGMMVLEMVGGGRNEMPIVENSSEVNFHHWIYDHVAQGVKIKGCNVGPESEEIARKLAVVGLWCTQTMSGNRPSMDRVVEMLEKSFDLEMPPRPYMSSPPCSMILSISSSK